MKKFTSKSQKIGELGETIACNYLISRGFSVVERNYTKKWGEIDIIAEKEGRIYFVEVKSVSCETLPDLHDDNRYNRQRPEDNMHPWKLKRLRRVVQTYLMRRELRGIEWQFDVLLIFMVLKERKARIKIIENVIL